MYSYFHVCRDAFYLFVYLQFATPTANCQLTDTATEKNRTSVSDLTENNNRTTVKRM